MREEKGKNAGGLTKEITQTIDAACKQVVLGEEIEKLKGQLTQQLSQAKDNLAVAQQQVTVWDTRIKQIVGSIGACNTMLQKSQKTKTLVLDDDHNKKGNK